MALPLVVRPFLYWTVLTATAWSPAGQSHASTGPQGAREQTADQQVHHVLNRLAFGARPGDYERVRQMGVDAWIDQQLDTYDTYSTRVDHSFSEKHRLMGRLS